MRGPVAFSVTVHILAITLAYVGLPQLMSYEEPTDRPIIVDLVTIAEKTNPPPPKPASEPAEKPAPKAAARPAPPPPPPTPAPAARPEPELAPVAKPDPVPPAPEPEPRKVASVPPAEPKPEPQAREKPKPKPDPAPEPEPEAKAPPKPAAKPAPPKPEPPKQAEKKPEPPKKEPEKPTQTAALAPKQEAKKRKDPVADFDQVLNSLNRIKQRVEQRDETQQTRAEADARPTPPTPQPNVPDQALTVSELDFIRTQIQRCWIVPIGAKGIEDMRVDIRVEMNRDGSVRDANILNDSRMQADPFYRTVAESARRAVLKCSPLQVPAKKFDQWQVMTLRFNPKDMLGS